MGIAQKEIYWSVDYQKNPDFKTGFFCGMMIILSNYIVSEFRSRREHGYRYGLHREINLDYMYIMEHSFFQRIVPCY